MAYGLYSEINWKKIWLVVDKFCLNNKVKEVSYKIMHQINPAKKTSQRLVGIIARLGSI